MTTMMSDLSDDLVEEILCTAPLISLGAVRSTCKLWNNISEDRVLCKAQARQQFLGFTMQERKFFSLRFDLHENFEFVEPSIKQIDRFKQLKISQVSHCDGLLLLVTKEDNNNSVVVWNPYLAQTRLIPPRNHSVKVYAFGYDDKCNRKILRGSKDYEIYDFRSSSWRVLDVIPDNWYIRGMEYNVSLKGNSYFIVERADPLIEICLRCFDFSRDRFGRCLSLPFHCGVFDTVVLSSTREEQLAVLFKHQNTSEIKIFVTTKIEPNLLSWSNFLTVDVTPLDFNIFRESFFIEQEKKLAVLFDLNRCNVACIIGENGYFRKVDLGKTHLRFCHPLVYSYYAPSLVPISKDIQP